MAFDTAFLDLMPHSVTIESWLKDDAYGKPKFGYAVSRQCRVVAKPQVIRDKDGRERVSRARVFMGGAFGIDPKDRITLPDGTQPPILQVQKFPDEDGAHHEVVLV